MGVLSAFMLSVSLAVAAIPEGLPAVVTVVLSLGVQKMAKSNAVIRRLPAVETLGAATYICSDKTGTLTQNKMTVTAACSPSGEIQLTGEEAKKLFSLAALCCDAKYEGKGKVSGEPTEAAIVAAAERSGTDTVKLNRQKPRTDEIPFSSERKMMSVAIRDGDKIITVAKGAPDVLIKKCSDIILNGTKSPLTSARREKILSLNASLAERALRVIAVATGETNGGKISETGLTFCGLIGMEDPPREEAYEAVKTCRRAGITPVMITGDHAGTACATAKKLGILSRSGECLTGAQIDKMGENEFARAVRSCRVYARVTPEHKVRIVKALRAHGEVVAMTGDGVNDSPALKLKENAVTLAGPYAKLNAETYGGGIYYSFFDRPMKIAGRVVTNENGVLKSETATSEYFVTVPSLAVHMNRSVNDGFAVNPQIDLLPLFALTDGETAPDFLVGLTEKTPVAYDLYVVNADKPYLFGLNNEFAASPRIDNLTSVWSSLESLAAHAPSGGVCVAACLDNEEVGSSTKQGAASTFLESTLRRLNGALGRTEEDYLSAVAGSFMISADNAHAVHPNHPEKADPTNRPYLNGGIVIKFHGSQKYTTDGISAAKMKDYCERAKVPYQTYANRSDIAGGSTLGNISTAHVSVSSVDIGLPQLAMHSAVETAGMMDTEYAVRALKEFWGE